MLALVLGVSIALALLLPPRYRATAQVLVASEQRDAGATGMPRPAAVPAVHLATQVDIVTSQRVALKVVEALRLGEDPAAIRAWRDETGGTGSIRHHFSDRLLAALDVRQGFPSSVLSIRYTADDPASAASIANAFADAYAEVMAELAADPTGEPPVDVVASPRSPRAGVVVLSRALPPARPDSPRSGLLLAVGSLLGASLGLAAALIAERRDRRVRGLEDLERASGVSPMCTLRDAFGVETGRRASRRPPFARDRSGAAAIHEAPETRPFPDTLANPPPERGGAAATEPVSAGAGASRVPIGQILVSAGLIHPPEVERILKWARADGVRFGEAAVARQLVTEDQLQRALACQFDFPVLDASATRVSPEVVAAFDPHNPLVADLRRLRARIRTAQLAAPPDGPLKTFAVISSGSGEGKSFLSANLAVAFSQTGQRTLLIDADLRRGRLHEVFGLDDRNGLSAMLNRRIEPGSLQRVPGLPNLGVVTCGPRAPNPSELLSRDVFPQLLASFARAYDVVILDTPGVAEEPDAMLIAQRAGAALVIARKDLSSFDAVVELVRSGGSPLVPVLGSVLNAA